MCLCMFIISCIPPTQNMSSSMAAGRLSFNFGSEPFKFDLDELSPLEETSTCWSVLSFRHRQYGRGAYFVLVNVDVCLSLGSCSPSSLDLFGM